MQKSEAVEEENTSKVVVILTVEKIENGVAYCDVELKVIRQPIESCPIE